MLDDRQSCTPADRLRYLAQLVALRRLDAPPPEEETGRPHPEHLAEYLARHAGHVGADYAGRPELARALVSRLLQLTGWTIDDLLDVALDLSAATDSQSDAAGTPGTPGEGGAP